MESKFSCLFKSNKANSNRPIGNLESSPSPLSSSSASPNSSVGDENSCCFKWFSTSSPQQQLTNAPSGSTGQKEGLQNIHNPNPINKDIMVNINNPSFEKENRSNTKFVYNGTMFSADAKNKKMPNTQLSNFDSTKRVAAKSGCLERFFCCKTTTLEDPVVNAKVAVKPPIDSYGNGWRPGGISDPNSSNSNLSSVVTTTKVLDNIISIGPDKHRLQVIIAGKKMHNNPSSESESFDLGTENKDHSRDYVHDNKRSSELQISEINNKNVTPLFTTNEDIISNYGYK